MVLLEAANTALLHGDESSKGTHNTAFVVLVVGSVRNDGGRREDLEAVQESLCLLAERKRSLTLRDLLLLLGRDLLRLLRMMGLLLLLL